MKNSTLIAILIGIIEMVYGQSTTQSNVRPSSGTPFPFIGWNSSGTAGSLEIRNDFNQPINFSTNGGLRATITSNGNIGVGTTDIRNYMHLHKATANEVYANFTNANTPIPPFVGSGGFRVGIEANGNARFIQHDDSKDIQFQLGNGFAAGGAMEIKNTTLNVGIGNVNYFDPQSKLHLFADQSPMYVQIGDAYSGGASTDGFKMGVNSLNIGNIPNAELRHQENAPMLFFTNNLERARITANGLVGIGADNPQVRLDVNGEAAIRTVNQNNNLTRVLFVNQNNGGRIEYRDLSTIGYGNVSACTTGTTNNRLARWTAANTICNSIIVDNGTKVGIGLTSPQSKLDVYSNSSDMVNIGTQSKSLGSSIYNMGGYFSGDGTAYQNVGIWAYANVTLNNIAYAGYFGGDVVYTGSLINASDAKLKEKVEDIDNALSTIAKLQPKEYDFKTSEYSQLNLPRGKHYGLLAQEVEAVLPQLVHDLNQPPVLDSAGNIKHEAVEFKGVNYTELIPLLLKGVKEQQEIIDSLSNVINNRLTALENNLNHCCGTSQKRLANPDDAENGNAHYQQVELANLQAIVLEQNVPNPFAEQTNISYFVPEDAGSAAIIFFDLTGRTIKSVNIEKGYGTITVFAQNLSQGTYSYSLVIDGKVAETKKMLKSR